MATEERFLKINELSGELGIAVRTIRTLTQSRKISCIRTGHRTVFYNPEVTRAELKLFQQRAVA